ncbi:MAG: amidohydrolase family protein [Gemmatimonadota bacterium]
MTRGAAVPPRVGLLLPLLLVRPALLTPGFANAQEATRISLAIQSATLIDGTGAAPVPLATVTLAGERIACAGTSAECPVPRGIRIVDGRGLWLIPGLIDTHLHLRFASDSVWSAVALRLALANGITAAREVSTYGQLEANLAAAAVSESAGEPMPRLQVAGRIGEANRERFRAADMPALARVLLGMGVEGIKIKGRLTLPELLAVLEDIGDAAPVYGHVADVAPRPDELRLALRAGVDGISHASSLGRLFRDEPPRAAVSEEERLALRLDTRTVWRNMDPELAGALIREMVADSVWLEPTLIGDATFADPAAYRDERLDRYVPLRYSTLPLDRRPLTERERRALDAGRKKIAEFVSRFHRAGGIVIAGSDNRYVPGFALHEELRLLSDAGLGPAAALRSATADAARALRRDDIGVIRPGAKADMVLLEADPLSDIRGTRAVRSVFKGGMEYAPPRLLSEAEGVAVRLREEAARGQGPGRKRRAMELGALAVLLIVAVSAVRRRQAGRLGSARTHRRDAG